MNAGNPTPPERPAPPLPDHGGAGDCANCGTALLGGHCHACGQPVKGLVRHFSSLAGDFVDSVFGYDARLPRTLRPLLLSPGQLTHEYFAGRRVRYVSPVRLFVFLAVITFFFAQLTLSFGNAEMLKVGGNTAIETALTVADVEQRRDQALAELRQARKQASPLTGVDASLIAAEATLRAQAAERIRILQDAIEHRRPPPPPRLNRLSFGRQAWDADSNPVRIAWLPAFANDWINLQTARSEKNLQRLREDPDLFKDALLGAVPSTLFVMLPLFALMLKLAYLFQRRLYMEHLIVALHSHAFLCLALLLAFATMALRDWLAPDAGALRTALWTIEAALWAWMPIHLLLMQKRIYGQGWPMTLLKYSVLGIFYTVLLSFGAMFTVLASLVSM